MARYTNRQKVKIFPLFVLSMVIIAITMLSAMYIKGDMAYYEDLIHKARLEQIELEARISALEAESALADQDSYVIDIARSKYGYLMPGEIRFQVTNIDSVLSEPEVEVVEVAE